MLPRATASIDDTITVSGPGTMVTVTASLQVTGLTVISGTSANGLVKTDIQGQVNVGNGAPQNGVSERISSVTPSMALTDTTVLTPPSIGTANGNDVSFLVEKQVQVMVGTPTAVHANLVFTPSSSTNSYSVIGDFGNTAHLTITLPAGYTYTSASGVLLSQAGGAGLSLPPDGGTGVGGMDMGAAPVDAGAGAPTDMSAVSFDDGGIGSQPTSSGGCVLSGGGGARAPATLLIVALLALARFASRRSRIA